MAEADPDEREMIHSELGRNHSQSGCALFLNRET